MVRLPLTGTLLGLLLLVGSAHAQSDLLFASGIETGQGTVGPAGGLVPGPDGVRLTVDEGALEGAVSFRIAADAAGAPPVPPGIALSTPVYAITPHGTRFDATAVVELPVPSGSEAVFLMKGEPGVGRWAVVAQAESPGSVLRSGVETLSYFAIGTCTPSLPAGSCPSGHQLRLDLVDGSGAVVPIDPANPQPVILLTQPELLNFRMRWTRPPLTLRTDIMDTGSAANGAVLVRTSGFAFGPGAPSDEPTPGNFDRSFGVTVTPALVSGAANLASGGVVRNIWAQARYDAGSASQAWDFWAFIPIRVYDAVGATAPFDITSQPQSVAVPAGSPATFTVATNAAAGSVLQFFWSRSPSATAPFSPIANASAATYTLGAATPADNGARFRVVVCSSRPVRCLNSNIATLTLGPPAPPLITQQPQDTSVVAGVTASFTVLAAVSQVLEVAWERSDDGGATWTAQGSGIPIAGGSRFDRATVLADDGAEFRAEVCNVIGPQRSCVLTSVAELTVTPPSGSPVITQQPQSQVTAVGAGARFEVVATGAPTLTYAWSLQGVPLPIVNNTSFNNFGCTGTVGYEAADAVLRLQGLSPDCAGSEVRVVVSNGMPPDAQSNAATIEFGGGGGQPGWGVQSAVLDFRMNLGLPQAEAFTDGAVVNDNGTLRLLAPGLGTLQDLATNVVGQPAVTEPSGQRFSYVLYLDNTPGSTCGPFSGDRLNARGLFLGSESFSISPPFVVATGFGCLGRVSAAMYVAAGQNPNVVFAAFGPTSTVPIVGRINQGGGSTWMTPNIEVAPLSAAGDCAGLVTLLERGIASLPRFVNSLPARVAVLAYESLPPGQAESITCSATLSSSGVWSSAQPVWTNGTVPYALGQAVVAMDAAGNSTLVGNRNIITRNELSTARLPVSASAWTLEDSFLVREPRQADLAADPFNGEVVVAWRDAPSAFATFTAPFATRRLADTNWLPPTRLNPADVETTFLRVTVVAEGAYLVLFQSLDNGRFRVAGRRFSDAQWSPAPEWIQPPGSPEGRFAVAHRYYPGFGGNPFHRLVVWWRETDPGDPTRTRIIRAVADP